MTGLVKKLDGMQKEQDGLVHANRVLHKDNKLLRDQNSRLKEDMGNLRGDINDERTRKVELRCIELETQNHDNLTSMSILSEQLKASKQKGQEHFESKNASLLFLHQQSQPSTVIDKTEITKFLGDYELDLELALEIQR